MTTWPPSGLTADLAANTVEVRTRAGLRRDPASERAFHLTSSCGVCGKAALEHVRLHASRGATGGAPAAGVRARLDPELIREIPVRARAAQRSFQRTGALHATALFDAFGELLVLREDVGRHNAMDKAIGAMLLEGRYPLPGVVACLSGRVSFELVQKARAGRAGRDRGRGRPHLACGGARGGERAGAVRLRARRGLQRVLRRLARGRRRAARRGLSALDLGSATGAQALTRVSRVE